MFLFVCLFIQDPDILPTLQVSDIPVASPDPTYVNTTEYTYDNSSSSTSTKSSTFMYTDVISNDLAYYKLQYDLLPLFDKSSNSCIAGDNTQRILAENIMEDNNYHLLLPTYAMCLTNMGAADMSYEELAQAIDLKTGGIHADINALSPLKDMLDENNRVGIQTMNDRLKYCLEINSMCLNRNIDSMLSLMEDILMSPKFDSFERLETLLKDKIQQDITHLVESGHSYAISHAASQFGPLLPNVSIQEKLDGISQIKFEGQLIRSLKSQRYPTMKELILLFNDISRILFHESVPKRSLLVADNHFYQQYLNNDTTSNNKANNLSEESIQKLSSKFLQPFAARVDPNDEANKSSLTSGWNLNLTTLEKIFGETAKIGEQKKMKELEEQLASGQIKTPISERERKERLAAAAERLGIENAKDILYDRLKNYFAVPSQVNYVGCVLPTVPYTDPNCGGLRLAAKLLSLNYLHREIREKGGAYGAGATQNKHLFGMFSYRDPNTLETVDIFKKSIEWLLTDGNVTERDLNEAKLSIFGTLDAPRNPSETGYQEFMQDIDEDIRQKHRESILNVDTKKLKEIVEEYLLTKFEKDQVAYTIVGKPEGYKDQKQKSLLEEKGFKVTNLE